MQPEHAEHCEMYQNDDPDDYCHGPQDFPCAQCGVRVCAWHAWASGKYIICSVCYGGGGYQRIADIQAQETIA